MVVLAAKDMLTMSNQPSSAAKPAAEKAWNEAKDAFAGNLSPTEQSHLAHSTIDDAFRAVADAEANFASSSKSHKVGSLLRPPLEIIARLAPALDVLSQIEPSILCPIWGSLRVMIMVLAKHTEFFDQVSTILARVTDHLPRICEYAELYPTSDVLHRRLVRTFTNLIRLFLEIHGVLKQVDTPVIQGQGKKFKAAAKSLFKGVKRNANVITNVALDRRIKICIEQFEQDSTAIDSDTRLLHYREANASLNKLAAFESTVQTHISKHTAQANDRIIREFFLWLSAENLTYQKDIERALSLKHPGTCEWINDNSSYKAFLGHSRSSIMWLHGKPGCGKTVLFANVAHAWNTQTLGASPPAGPVYTHMFNNKSSGDSANSSLIMLRALIQQQYFKTQGSDFITSILGPAISGRSQTHATSDELAKLFTQLARAQHEPIHVLIDALDEAENPLEVADWIRDLTSNAVPGLLVKVFITSRPFSGLQSPLKDVISLPMELGLVDQDIDRYIPSCLNKISDEHPGLGSTRLRLIETTLQKSHNGLFLWARLLTDFLLSLPSVSDVMDSLSRLPDTLSGLYRQMFAGLCTSLAGNVPRQRLVRKTILWLCHTQTRITLGALSEAFAINPGDNRLQDERIPLNITKLLQDLLGAFIEIHPHGKDDFLIQFVHLSMKDFFLHDSPLGLQAQDVDLQQFFSVSEQANEEIAQTLFRYLSFTSRKTLQADLSFTTHDKLLHYASTWCCTHLRASGQRGVTLLPLVRSLISSRNGSVWLDNARSLNEDDGAHFAVLHAELKSWRQSFSAADAWLDEVIPSILKSALSYCKTDTIEYFRRAYHLTQFLELVGQRSEPLKILLDCHKDLGRVADPKDPEYEVLVWSLTLQLGRMQVLGGQPVQALDLYDELLNRSMSPGLGVRSVRNRLLEHSALIERGLGDLNKSGDAYEKVCKAWSDLVGRDGVHTMRAYGGLATVFDMQGRLEEAEQLQLRVLTTIDLALGSSHPLFLQSQHDLGSIYEYQGRLSEAEDLYQRCLKGRTKMLGEENAKTLTTMHNFALVYEAQGRIMEAKRLSEKVLKLRVQILGDMHGDTGRAYNSMASICFQLGDYNQATVYAAKAYTIKQNTLKTRYMASDHPSAMVTASLTAGILQKKGELAEASRTSQELIASLNHAMLWMTTPDRKDTHPSLMSAYNNAGVVDASMGMFASAESLFQNAYDGRCLSLGASHILTLRSLGNLAWACVKVGNNNPESLNRAKKYYGKARVLSFSLPSSQLARQFGTECLDKALFIHSECYVSRLLGLLSEAYSLQTTLDGLISFLTIEGSEFIDGEQVRDILTGFQNSKSLVLDNRWERLRDIR